MTRHNGGNSHPIESLCIVKQSPFHDGSSLCHPQNNAGERTKAPQGTDVPKVADVDCGDPKNRVLYTTKINLHGTHPHCRRGQVGRAGILQYKPPAIQRMSPCKIRPDQAYARIKPEQCEAVFIV